MISNLQFLLNIAQCLSHVFGKNIEYRAFSSPSIVTTTLTCSVNVFSSNRLTTEIGHRKTISPLHLEGLQALLWIRTWSLIAIFCFLIIIFNWKITALQYCVGFCQKSTWISHRYTYVPSLLNLPPTSLPIPPLKVVTEMWFEFPESYSKFLLATYFTYGNTCFHVTFSIHPSLSFLCLPSPLVCSLCFYLHCCPANKFISIIFLDSIYMP